MSPWIRPLRNDVRSTSLILERLLAPLQADFLLYTWFGEVQLFGWKQSPLLAILVSRRPAYFSVSFLKMFFHWLTIFDFRKVLVFVR